MKFEELLPYLRMGRKITNSAIKNSGYQYIYYKSKSGTIFDDKGGFYHLTFREIVDSDDWEIVKEKKKVKLRDLTEEQLKKWQQTNCIGGVCRNCVFNNNGYCVYLLCCWAEDKSIFSDKFLDQEIEIDEE